MSGLFRPAVKEQLKGRVALCGPTGSGKTWTALGWATELAQGGKIAFIDTERRSASLYAPHFTFDKIDWAPPYDPAVLIETIRAAESDGYAVLVIDSLTHFWTGEGGTLDVVDNAKNRGSGNQFDAWRVGTPLQRTMVDTILAAEMHVIVTMRSKMEYILEETTKNGRTTHVPKKVGMAPEQRAGIEYEFTIVGDMDYEHRIVMTKSRCDILADHVIQPHRERDAAKTFLAWLDDGKVLATAEDKAKIGVALRNLDEEPRAKLAAQIREQFGPPDNLRAEDVDAALALIADELMQLAEDATDDATETGDESTAPPPDEASPTDDEPPAVKVHQCADTKPHGAHEYGMDDDPIHCVGVAEPETDAEEQERLGAESESQQAQEANERAAANA